MTAPSHMSNDGQEVRTVPWFGPLQRLKARYQRLHPAAQMIGLQLWLPLIFSILFVICYVAAFHAPRPHSAPIGVSGSAKEVRLLNTALAKADPGGFSVQTVAPGDVRGAVTQVRKGNLEALYQGGAHGTGTLTYASANGEQISATVTELFNGLATASGTHLKLDDLAPLPSHDAIGTSVLYVSLAATIAGYMVGMFTGMMGAPLARRVRWRFILGLGLVTSLLISVLSDPVLGALQGHFWELWATLFGTALAVGLVVDGLGYFFGRFVTGAALVLFVFLNLPSSGGAIPFDFVPEPFRWLHHVVLLDGDAAILRHIFYGAGPGAGLGIVRVLIYGAAGLLLACSGPHFAVWRRRRRAALGLPLGGMMGQAQHQLMMAAAAGAQPKSMTDGRAAPSTGSATEAESVVEETAEDRDSGQVVGAT